MMMFGGECSTNSAAVEFLFLKTNGENYKTQAQGHYTVLY